VVPVHGAEEMVALGERLNVGAVAGGECHGQPVQRIKLISNCFVKKQENQNRRLRFRALQVVLESRGGVHVVDGIREHRHSSSVQRRRHSVSLAQLSRTFFFVFFLFFFFLISWKS